MLPKSVVLGDRMINGDEYGWQVDFTKILTYCVPLTLLNHLKMPGNGIS